MKNKALITMVMCCLLYISSGSFAQAKPGTISITGEILNEKQEPVTYGTIVVVNKLNGKLVKTQLWEKNSFTLTHLPAGVYVLSFSSKGYADKTAEASGQGGEVKLGNIVMQLQPVNMQGVMVSAKKPLVQMEADRISFNVSNISMAAGGTTDELLQKTPRVMSAGNNNFIIVGKGAALVLLNGQRVPADVLTSLPSGDIDRIDVITNPPVSMEAAGRGIINIVTKPRAVKTANNYAVIDLSAAHGVNWRYNAGITAGMRKKKWSIEGSFRYFPAQFQYTDSYYREMQVGQDFYAFDQSIIKDRNLSDRYNARLSGLYTISKYSSLSWYANNTYSGGIENIRSLTGVNTLLPADAYQLINNTAASLSTTNRSAGIAWQTRLDTTGKELSIVADYNGFRSNRTDNFLEQLKGNDGNFTSVQRRSDAANNINISAVQAGLMIPLKKWKGRFETGARFSYIASGNMFEFSDQNSGNWVKNTNRSDAYDYSEKTTALYTSVSGKKGKWTMRAGVRAEYTALKGVSVLNQRTVTDNDYLALFPNLSMQYALNKKWAWELNYSRRILRPTYQDINPFIIYNDSLSVFQGNPLLRPEFAHSFETNIVYLKTISLKIGYNLVNDNIQKIVSRTGDSSHTYAGSLANISRAREFSVILTVPYQRKKWTMTNVAGFFNNHYNSNIGGLPFGLNQPYIYCYSFHQYALPGNASVEGSVTYNSRGGSGVFIFNSRFNAMLGFSKMLLQKRLKLNLSANDIFRTEREWGNTNVNNLAFRYNSYRDNFNIRMAVSYRFGGANNKPIKVSTGDADLKRIKPVD
jgi:type 1 fimbria pilin